MLGVLTFEVQVPIAVGGWMVLWLILINRWLRLSGALRVRVARLGERDVGGVVGLGSSLPWMSLPQLMVFGVGAVLGVIGMLGIPIWFLLLGRHLT